MPHSLAYYVTLLRKKFVLYRNQSLQELGLSQRMLFFILIGKYPGCSHRALTEALQMDAGHVTRSLGCISQARPAAGGAGGTAPPAWKARRGERGSHEGGSKMKYAVVYSSRTGNTAMLAEEICRCLPAGECGYCGAPDAAPADAQFLFAGFWTDKGGCDAPMAAYLGGLRGKQVFLFGTAGFGGEPTYFEQIIDRAEQNLDPSNTVAGSFMCQGRMPMAVRRRYEAMAAHDPAAAGLLANFDRALSHPDAADLAQLAERVSACLPPPGPDKSVSL